MAEQQQTVTVRRATARDADKISTFVKQLRGGRATIDRLKVIERFGSVGFLVAEQGDQVVGILGWRAENLVVRVIDFLLASHFDRVAVARSLLSKMEEAAVELECEASLLVMPYPYSPHMVRFCQMLGYEPQVVSELPRAWREAAYEANLGDGDLAMIKKLREGRVLRPL